MQKPSWPLKTLRPHMMTVTKFGRRKEADKVGSWKLHHAPESPLRLSMNSRSTVAFIRSPRQLLQSDTGVPHFALDPLTYRCLLSLSPAADFAEPRPPRHIPPPPDSGREALRPAAPPPLQYKYFISRCKLA